MKTEDNYPPFSLTLNSVTHIFLFRESMFVSIAKAIIDALVLDAV
jgi:hypothetical protein